MKLLVIYVALCFHLSVQRVQAGECYEGTSREGVGNMTVDSCDFSRLPRYNKNLPQESCMTKIELNHGVTILTRQCLQTKACGPNIANNQQQCYSENAINNQVQLCYFCCNDANLCNDFATIPPLPIQPTVFPPITDTTIFPPIFPETTTPSPTVPETTTPPPVVAETTTPPPTVPETTNPPPVVAETTTTPPTVPETTATPPVVAETTAAPPVVAETTTPPPAVNQTTFPLSGTEVAPLEPTTA